MRRLQRITLLVLALSLTAAMSPDISPPPGARLPLDAPMLDETGRRMTPGQAIDGRPAVLVFADWTCSALCGTTLGQAAMALRQTRLVPGRDYAFLAIGIDPRDGPQQATAMKAVHLADNPSLLAASHFLSGDAATTERILKSLGYRATFLPDEDQFAHPAALLILAADGRLRQVMPSLMLEPAALRAALTPLLVPADFTHHVLLICHALLTGAYGGWVPDALMVAGMATVLCLGGALLVLFRRGPGR